MAPESLTIGALARAAGVPASTVRYYERAGLLRPRQRSPSNYRLYGAEDLHRLRFIRAQATGFALEDVRELLRPAPCGRVQGLIEARLVQVRGRIADRRHVERVPKESLAQCRAHAPTGRCGVIDSLSARAREGRRPVGDPRRAP